MNWTRTSALVVKELLAAFRDPKARIALDAPPLMQLLLYAFAATMEVTNVPIGVLNQDWGLASTQLISRFEHASALSRRSAVIRSPTEVQRAIDSQEVMVVVEIDQDFSRKLAHGETPQLQVLLDGRKSNSAQIVNGYLNTIVAQFASDYADGRAAAPPSEIVDRHWYNPNREYRTTMVPSLLGTLTMMTVMMIVGMSVARERELGTFEQLLVSPLQPIEIFIGKAVPGLIVGLAQGAVITLIVTLVFGIALTGSALVLFAGLTVFLIAVIGVGAVHLLAGLQSAAGDDGHHGLHDAGDAAVRLHLARAEHAGLAAAGRHDQSAHAFPRDRARRVPARHAVLISSRRGYGRWRPSRWRRWSPRLGCSVAARNEPATQRPTTSLARNCARSNSSRSSGAVGLAAERP